MGPFVMSVIGLGVRITFPALHCWTITINLFQIYGLLLFTIKKLKKVQCKEMSLVFLIIYIFSLQWSSVKVLIFLTSIL